MGNTSLTYKERFEQYLAEVRLHLLRIDEACEELAKRYQFVLDETSFATLQENTIDVAFADQIIYRFSKVQDTMGTRLFKTFLLYQGENVDRPFLDILHALEQQGLLNVEQWFVLREIRNEITHNYASNADVLRQIVNSIYTNRDMVRRMIDAFAEAGSNS